jgi:hypothetical protein
MTHETWHTAEEEADHRKERKRLSENHYNRAQGLAAWLLATLVAVNGAAVIAILTRDHPVPDADRLPAIAFIAGVILAITSGFCSWRDAYQRSSLYYFESLRADQLTAVGQRRKERAATWSKLLAPLTRYTNYAALFAFVGGCVWSACTFV